MRLQTGFRHIGKEDRQRFATDGYLVIDDPCPLELLDALRTEFESMFRDAWDPGPQVDVDGVMYDHYTGRPGEWHWHRIKNAWKISDNARAVALNPTVLGIIEDLFERKVMPFQTLNFPIGTQQREHSDSFHFQSDPPGNMCGVWIALEDMDMDNGPLIYYPGSHKLPIPTWPEIEAEMGETVLKEDYPTHNDFLMARSAQYERYCQRLIERENLKPEYGTVRKGQAVLWAPNLLHGGAPQNDQSRTRHSQVTHYFLEGCRVFTPLHTEGDHNFWNYPEWIRDPVPTYSPDLLRDTIEAHVPAGSNVIVLAQGNELPELAGRATSHFPQDEQGNFVHLPDDAKRIEHLEELRAQGAQFLVVPKQQLGFLEYGMPALQEHLEDRYTAVVRDGAVCALYPLD